MWDNNSSLEVCANAAVHPTTKHNKVNLIRFIYVVILSQNYEISPAK